MLAGIGRLNPFKTAEARRLAVLFGVVYFAQGMWYLPLQAMQIALKARGLSAGQVADFMLISTLPWLAKPAYGLISDFVPLFGRRRQSYLLLTSGLAAAAGFALALAGEPSYWRLAALYTAMGLGLAFTDVLIDALMVESGRARGLTGAFQSVQWAAIYGASILVGIVGGYFAETRNLTAAFTLAACFPLVSFAMTVLFIREPPAPAAGATFRETWRAIRSALTRREVWLVAGFIFCFTFSPSFGPAFLYYQTDVLKFSQQFIGALASLNSVGWIAGAVVYLPLSRRLPLQRRVVVGIGATALTTLAYLGYGGGPSALVIEPLFGCVAMITQLALLELAAKTCPPGVEATFFALFMSVYNAGSQLSMNVGGRLYDWLGYTPLVIVSATATALAWALVPLVGIGRIEARARAGAAGTSE